MTPIKNLFWWKNNTNTYIIKITIFTLRINTDTIKPTHRTILSPCMQLTWFMSIYMTNSNGSRIFF